MPLFDSADEANEWFEQQIRQNEIDHQERLDQIKFRTTMAYVGIALVGFLAIFSPLAIHAWRIHNGQVGIPKEESRQQNDQSSAKTDQSNPVRSASHGDASNAVQHP